MPSKSRTPPPTPLEDLQRAAVEQDKETLRSMDIVIGQPLDVDGSSDWDLATNFFRPWVPKELIRGIEEREDCRRTWLDKYVSEFEPAEWQIPRRKARWFVDCLYWLCELDNSIRDPWDADPSEMRRATGGLELPMHLFTCENGQILREYHSKWAYFPVDKEKPHIACFVFDSNDPRGNRVLRSEVDYALELVKYRLQRGQHTNHHTKPALIYTLERDASARITQAYFDGKSDKLVLRQSRQLDLRGAEPTDDAFILLRWMANRPVGETEYVDEDELEEEEVVQSNSSEGAAPRLVVGCA